MNLNLSFPRLHTIAEACTIVAILLTAGGCKETTNQVSEDLSDPSIMPEVLSSFPVSGSTGPFSLYNRGDGGSKPHFILTFNKLMYKGSFTTKSFRIQGFDRPVAARIEGNYYYPLDKTPATNSIYYDNVLSFFIIDSFSYYSIMSYRVGQQVTITLDSTVADINGNHLIVPFTFTYTPEPYFRVVSMYPKNGSTDINTSTNLNIYFNSPVGQTILNKIQLGPPVAGYWQMSYDSFYVYFQPSQGYFPYNSTFTMNVQASATDAEFHQIDRGYASTFSIIPFRATYFYPRNGTTNFYLTDYINVGFSGLIDTGTVRSGFGISPAVPGIFSLYYPSSGFSFSALNGFRQNTTYTLSVTPSLHASDGTPAQPSTSTFTTGLFQVTSTYPANGSVNVSRLSSVQIGTNAPLDGTTVNSAISFSPPVTGSVSFSDVSNYFSFTPGTLLLANTLYTATVTTALGTKAGDRLLAPYTFTFTTGSY